MKTTVLLRPLGIHYESKVVVFNHIYGHLTYSTFAIDNYALNYLMFLFDISYY